jgi:hypothetical protein
MVALALLFVLAASSAQAADAAAYSRDELKALASRIADEEGVPPALFDALITAESNYRVDAVSPKGAMSLAQLMPATAAELGLGAADYFEPEANLRGGARYLKAQLNASGDVAVALAAYNAGPARVKDRPFEDWPRETRAYVSGILKRIETTSRHTVAQRFIGSIVSMPKLARADEEVATDTPTATPWPSSSVADANAVAATPSTQQMPIAPSEGAGDDGLNVDLRRMIDLSTGVSS